MRPAGGPSDRQLEAALAADRGAVPGSSAPGGALPADVAPLVALARSLEDLQGLPPPAGLADRIGRALDALPPPGSADGPPGPTPEGHAPTAPERLPHPAAGGSSLKATGLLVGLLAAAGYLLWGLDRDAGIPDAVDGPLAPAGLIPSTGTAIATASRPTAGGATATAVAPTGTSAAPSGPAVTPSMRVTLVPVPLSPTGSPSAAPTFAEATARPVRSRTPTVVPSPTQPPPTPEPSPTEEPSPVATGTDTPPPPSPTIAPAETRPPAETEEPRTPTKEPTRADQSPTPRVEPTSKPTATPR